MVLEIAQHLARTLDLEPLLDKLLDHLLRLFPQADRGMVLLCEGERLMCGASARRQRRLRLSLQPDRRRQALDEGVGILSDDVRADQRLLQRDLMSLDLRSFLCVPLIGRTAGGWA